MDVSKGEKKLVLSICLFVGFWHLAFGRRGIESYVTDDKFKKRQEVQL